MKKLFAGILTAFLIVSSAVSVSAESNVMDSDQKYKDQLIDLLIEYEHKEGDFAWGDAPWGDNAALWDDSITKMWRTEAGIYPSMYFLDIDNDGDKEFLINDDGWEASIDNAVWIFDVVDGKLDVSYAGMSGRSLEIYSGDGEYLVLTNYKEPYFDMDYEMRENVTCNYEAVLLKNSEYVNYQTYVFWDVDRTAISNEGNKDKNHYYKYEMNEGYNEAVETTEDEYNQFRSDLIGNKTKAILNYELIQAKDYSGLTEQEKREVLSRAYDSSEIVFPDSDNSIGNNNNDVKNTPDSPTEDNRSNISNSSNDVPKSPKTGVRISYTVIVAFLMSGFVLMMAFCKIKRNEIKIIH